MSTPAYLSSVSRVAWPLALVVTVGMGLLYLDRSHPMPTPASEMRVEHAGPTLVERLRSLSRLETAALHVEKVIDIRDHQSRLYGLVPTEDALLFVAAGEVTLGVDLSKADPGATRFDEASRTAYIQLPDPEILGTRFDEASSYVHTRSTGALAHRNEALEGRARREALVAFEAAGRDARHMAQAREQAERQLVALGKAWGAREVVVTWSAGGATAEQPARAPGAPPSELRAGSAPTGT